MTSCRSYIREVKSESVVIIIAVLEHIVQIYPSHVPSLLSPILPNLLTDTLEEVVCFFTLNKESSYCLGPK